MKYDTSRDPQRPLIAGSQVLFRSLIKLMIDMRDIATGIVEVVSGKRRSPHSRGKRQVSQGWLKRDQSSSTEEQYATQGGTPPVLRNG